MNKEQLEQLSDLEINRAVHAANGKWSPTDKNIEDNKELYIEGDRIMEESNRIREIVPDYCGNWSDMGR